MTTINTNFNARPYYDDYDETKQFARILFKPGFAVQARELTQLQTIIQQQVRRFGEHVFKHGSIVSGGLPFLDNTIEYVKVNDLDAASAAFDITDFVGATFTGSTSGVKAYVDLVADGTESATNKKTLFVRYLSSGSDGDTKVFAAGETITSSVGNLVVYNTTPTGRGLVFYIDEGTIFAKDHFLYFPKQSIIVSRYSTTASARIGFNLTEEIVTSSVDESLLDPALGSSNYFAIGADRFKLSAVLTTDTPEDFETSADYIELVKVTNGSIIEIAPNPDYNILQEEFAKRTRDASGDFIVNGMTVSIKENLDNGENNGLLTAGDGGNVDFLSYAVEPGTAYVDGYYLANEATQYLTVPKAKTYETTDEAVTTARFGNYVTVNELSGGLRSTEEFANVHLGDGYINYVSNTGMAQLAGTDTYGGNLIGFARVKTVKYRSGLLGTRSGNADVYLFDIKMLGSNSFAQVKSLWGNETTDDFSANVITENGEAVLKQTSSSALLLPVGQPFVRKVKDSSDTTDLTHNYLYTVKVPSTTGPTFQISAPGSDTLKYGSSVGATLTELEKEEIFVTIEGQAQVSFPSIDIQGTSGSNTITSNSAIFTNLNVGDLLTIANVNPAGTTYFTIESIGSSTTANVTPAPTTNISFGNGNSLIKAFAQGSYIDLKGKGSTAGATRSVTIVDSSTVTIDLKEQFDSSEAVYITFPVVRSDGSEIGKTLKPNRYVQISCATSGTTGPFNLGIADVYQIREVRLDSSAFSSATQGTDVTSSFVLDNGQRDDFYDHAKITPKITLTGSDYLLVKLDYFEPVFSTGASYFTVDSYPIDDVNTSNDTIQTSEIPIYTSPITGLEFDLRNFLDFRPVKFMTATDTTSVGSASTSPGDTNSFYPNAGEKKLVYPDSLVNYDYSYYLPRVDIIQVDKDKNFSVVQGVPTTNPITPTPTPGNMQIARVAVTPYPSVAPNYAGILRRKDLAVSHKLTGQVRFTMRDINVLEQRITALEYYVTLNALEKSAIDITIPDENGLDRLKNGIFVDAFTDHTLGDTTNPDYRISIDPREKCLRPLFVSDSISYNYITGSGITKTGDLITLPYTETVLLEQPNFTTFRNVETSVYRFIGNLYLDPETDVWNKTKWVDDNTVEFNLNLGEVSNGGGVKFGDWQENVIGYELYNATTGTLLATFNTYAEAYHNAIALHRNVLVANNTFGYTGSRVITDIREKIEKTRIGFETSTLSDSDTQTLGSKVVNVEFQGYIPGRFIKLNGKGLKAATKLYTFFDGQDVTDLVTPTNSSYQRTASEGTRPTTSASGEFYAILRIPADKFTVGTKEIVVTDSPTKEDDATTSARRFYTHYGLIQEKNNTILTTRATVNVETPFLDSTVETSDEILHRQNLGSSCSAYSFLVKAPKGETGVFLTSVDVFFQAKSAQYGVWFEIREMNSAGGITRNAVPFSEVWYTSSQIPVSDDASTPLNVQFPSPVFLYNNTQYAFVIHTEGINPDTYIWVSKLGQTDLGTNQPVTSRPLTGTYYVTNNNLNWDMLPDYDLKVKFYRASFTTGSGTVDIGNKPVEAVTLGNASAIFNFLGETVKGYDQVTTTTPSGGSISVTNRLVGANSGITANVTAISSSTYRTDGRGFIVGEALTVQDSGGTPTGVTADVATVNNATGILRQFKTIQNVEIAQLIETSNTFYVGDVIKGQLSNVTASIDTIETEPYYLVNFQPSFLNFNGTDVSSLMRSVEEATNTHTSFSIVDVGNNFEFINQRVILSRTQENALLSGRSSNEARLTLTTGSEYVAPIVDIGRTHSVYVRNLINDDDTGETNPIGGNLTNKYISKIVTLAEGQDAEDMLLYVTAYRPPLTDFKVYVKFKNNEDSDLMTAIDWIELNKATEIFSSKSITTDYKEFEFRIPEASKTGPNGEFQYTNSQGATFTGFKYFQIKIGLTGSGDKSITPKVADLRAIALQL